MKSEISYKGQKITVEGTAKEISELIEENQLWEKEHKNTLNLETISSAVFDTMVTVAEMAILSKAKNFSSVTRLLLGQGSRHGLEALAKKAQAFILDKAQEKKESEPKTQKTVKKKKASKAKK